MTALTQERSAPYIDGLSYNDPVAAGVKCYQGGIAVLDASGNVKPGITSNAVIARGVFAETVDNTGGIAGALTVTTNAGKAYRFVNAGDIDRTFIGKTAYIVDDQTVSSSSSSGARSACGTIKNIDSSGVYVQIG